MNVQLVVGKHIDIFETVPGSYLNGMRRIANADSITTTATAPDEVQIGEFGWIGSNNDWRIIRLAKNTTTNVLYIWTGSGNLRSGILKIRTLT